MRRQTPWWQLYKALTVFLPSQLCYLYADMHKQTSSKESRRFFMEFHSLFMDRTAVSYCALLVFPPSSFLCLYWAELFVLFRCFQNLKVPVPETVAAELGMSLQCLTTDYESCQLFRMIQDVISFVSYTLRACWLFCGCVFVSAQRSGGWS